MVMLAKDVDMLVANIYRKNVEKRDLRKNDKKTTFPLFQSCRVKEGKERYYLGMCLICAIFAFASVI